MPIKKNKENIFSIDEQNYLRAKFFSTYRDKHFYIKDEEHDVYIHFERYKISQINKVERLRFVKELKCARAFSHEFCVELYMLPQELEKSFIAITNGKNPDAIANYSFIELKQSSSGFKSSFNKLLREGANQTKDVVYIDSEIKPKARTYFELIKSTVNSNVKDKSKYDCLKVVVSTAFKNFEIYEIKNREVYKLDSLWRPEELEAPQAIGYQDILDNLNVEYEFDNVNEDVFPIEKQKSLRAKFFSTYRDKHLYIKVDDHDVYVHSDRVLFSNINKVEYQKLAKEILSAKAFSKKFKAEIFLLPQEIDKSFIVVTRGKNPDAIAEKHFIEFKQSNTGTKSSIKRLLRDGAEQSQDIVYINSECYPVNDTYLDYIKFTIKGSNYSSKYEGLRVVISTKFEDFESYEIKNREVYKIDSPLQHGKLEAPQANGYQGILDNLNVEYEFDNVNEDILSDVEFAYHISYLYSNLA